jgi:ribosomal protein L15
MDFWARGAYHRAKKIARGPRSKKGTRLTIGMDGFRRKRKKGRSRQVAIAKPDCLNYDLFCRSFGSCDGQVCEYE